MPTVAPPISVFFATIYSSLTIVTRSTKDDIWILLPSILLLQLRKNWLQQLVPFHLHRVRTLLRLHQPQPICNNHVVIWQLMQTQFHILRKTSMYNFSPVKFVEQNFQVTILFINIRKFGTPNLSIVHQQWCPKQAQFVMKMLIIEMYRKSKIKKNLPTFLKNLF